MFTTNSMTNIM